MLSKNKKTIISKKAKSGFTLLEVMVAIFVILVGVLGAYSVVQKIIFETHQSSFRLTAAYLAQEGVEIVRNIRDNNWLNGGDWNNGIEDCDDESFYQADYKSNDLGSCINAASGAQKLNVNGEGFYAYDDEDTGKTSPFIRKILITRVSDNMLKVVVKVFWYYKNNLQGPITVEDYLYNWHQEYDNQNPEL
ncbi:MAG TPA: prepilin-type N-terminal cleavage/methylation domain-containing protein [Candidatus Parcubacteria bacterium]|nr:prepilin-type N-terminal cleavage/methylation domain-containing protein [Candidatus Parcubacteria bacterium]